MELKFTAEVVANIEEEAHMPITEFVGQFSLKTILMFVKKGMNISKEQALTEIDTFLQEGGDTMGLYLNIMERLQKDGFLPKALNIEAVRAKMDKAVV